MIADLIQLMELLQMNEGDLSVAIKDFLNRTSIDYSFEFINSFCDIADEKHKIYIEVKPDHFAPAQLLHAIAREQIKDALYLGVADSERVLLYDPPPFKKILAFAKTFDPTLSFTPSQLDKPELNKQAEKLLGKATRIIELSIKSDFQFITKENLKEYWSKDESKILNKYKINPVSLVKWLDGAFENKEKIIVTDEGWLMNTSRMTDIIFTNENVEETKQRELDEFSRHRKPKHKPIKDENDKMIISALRILKENVQDVLHETDRYLPRPTRRKSGKFWTEQEIGTLLADRILDEVKPDYMVEPCAGLGSLVKDMISKVKGTMNDYDANAIDSCHKLYDGFDWKFTVYDIVMTGTEALLKVWGVPESGTLLLYTNPPFGTSSTNKQVSKKGEINGFHGSRKLEIQYGDFDKRYGKGDLILPIIGRLIEVAKTYALKGTCFLGFFSQMALFCEHSKYMKLASAILKDFEYIFGYTFAGAFFHDIAKTKPISFTLWKFHANADTNIESLTFTYIEPNSPSAQPKIVDLKRMPLLKEGWNYNNTNHIRGEIVAQRNDAFNQPTVKAIHLHQKNIGSEMVPENVRKPLSIPHIPDELFYGLWSVTVGAKSMGTNLTGILHPIYFDNAFTHLPDISRQETMEILAYSALYSMYNNYANDRIGFIGINKVFRFGGDVLTKGVEYLLDTHGDCHVYDDLAIKDVLAIMKDAPDTLDKGACRKGIIHEIYQRLDAIGYWDHVPLPLVKKSTSKAPKRAPKKGLKETKLVI